MGDRKSDDLEVLAPIAEASPQVQRIIKKILELEYGKVYLERHYIIDDLLRIIKEEVK